MKIENMLGKGAMGSLQTAFEEAPNAAEHVEDLLLKNLLVPYKN